MTSKREKNRPLKKDARTEKASFWKTKVLGPSGISLALALCTLAVFWPVVTHEFVNLDDQVYVTENAHVQAGLTWANILWAFTNLNAGFWHPLTWLSIMLDCQLFGLRAGGHHLTSLFLHVANTVLLFTVLRRMTLATWRSAFVAALFALHPLHVESVAWAADRKDLLSTFFWMLTMLAYLRYVEAGRITNSNGKVTRQPSVARRKQVWWYVAALFCFVCSIMSKTMVVSLPFVLLLLDWWPLHRFQTPNLKRLVLEKLPFLAVSFFAGLLTVQAESGVGALPGESLFPLQFRLANGLLSCIRYLAQVFWPAGLAVFYPYPHGFSILATAGAALFLVLVLVLFFRRAKQAPYLLVGWLWYLVALLPVIGLIQVGGHARADRYTYVPLIGIFLLLAWGAYDVAKRWRAHVLILSLTGMVAVALCAGLTRRQIAFWKNSETLFRHAIEVTPDNYVAYYCFGIVVSDHGDRAEAIRCYQAALQINPAYAEAYNHLGVELAMSGKMEEAIGDFRSAIHFSPTLAGAHSNLGLALATQGKLGEATTEYLESLRLKPDDARVQGNLGNALDEQGRLDEAIIHYRAALQLDPANPDIHVYLGMSLAKQGKREEAASQYNEALRLKPDDAQARQALEKLK